MNSKLPVTRSQLKQLTIKATLMSILFAGCSSPLIYSSIWQDKPVIVDGNADEWKIPLDYYDDKSKLNFSVSNDGSNLYICVRATEDVTQKGIVRNGLQIFIDTTGGKKKKMGIQFPIIQHREKPAATAGKETMQDPSTAVFGLKKQYSSTTKQMRITGFPGGIDGLSDLPNMYGINAYLNWDANNIMIYEVCIPLKTFYKPSLSKSDSAKVIGISFVVTVAGKNGGGGGDEGGGSHTGGMGGGGMGGMHGGGGGGGGRHGGGGGGGSSSETFAAYIKLRLVTGPFHM